MCVDQNLERNVVDDDEVIWCAYLLLIFLSSAVSFVKVSLARRKTLTRLNE